MISRLLAYVFSIIFTKWNNFIDFLFAFLVFLKKE